MIEMLARDIQNEIEDLRDALERCADDHIYQITQMIRREALKGSLPIATSKYAIPAEDDWEWLWRARSDDDMRPALHYIHVKDGLAQCTNGHILFMADVKGRDDGCYRYGEDTNFNGVMFPDTSRVIPQPNKFQPIKIEDQDGDLIKLENGSTVKDYYFALAVESSPNDWEASYQDDTARPILFKHKKSTRRAVIMPARG